MFGIGKIENLKTGIEYIIVRKDKIEQLETEINHQKEVIERQGSEAYRRHEFLCTIKEIVDSYFEDN